MTLEQPSNTEKSFSLPYVQSVISYHYYPQVRGADNVHEVNHNILKIL